MSVTVVTIISKTVSAITKISHKIYMENNTDELNAEILAWELQLLRLGKMATICNNNDYDFHSLEKLLPKESIAKIKKIRQLPVS